MFARFNGDVVNLFDNVDQAITGGATAHDAC